MHIFKKLLNIRTALAIGLILMAIVVFVVTRPAAQTNGENGDSTREVQIASVANLTRGVNSFATIGSVASQKEVTLYTESSGRITYVGYDIGDNVGAGTIIAEIENASQRAAVLQATGGRDAAQANLDKVKKGTRSEQISTLESSVQTARLSTQSALLSAYAAMDDVVHQSADLMFSNPNGSTPDLLLVVSDSQLSINAEASRQTLTPYFARQNTVKNNLDSVDIQTEVTTTKNELLGVRTFLDAMIAALDKTVPSPANSSSQITTYKSSMSAARTSISTSLNALNSASGGLANAELALEQGVAGAQDEDIAAAEAALTQARGSLAAALASLEKTRIRTPISGTINALSLNLGDFVSNFSPVATVANNQALEITTYINEAEAPRITVGEKVTINETVSGTITRIAPALDPTTKKIEVKIGVDSDVDLINGASVSISFDSDETATTAPLTQLIVPLTAVKLGADSTSLFTLSADKKLVAHSVTLGTLLGDRVVILSGITESDIIVVDARGLHEGQVVTVE